MSRSALNVAWYRFRSTFGQRWGGYLTIVLLVGLVGGLALGAETERPGLADDGPDARRPGTVGQGVNSSGHSFTHWLVEFAQRLTGTLLNLDPVGHGS
jgi:hypothetical protein